MTIIKSLSRKDRTFRGLIEYFHKEHNNNHQEPTRIFQREVTTISKNLPCNCIDKEQIITEFETNSQLVKDRVNGNYLYHEVLSIPEQKGIPIKKQEEILYDLTDQFLDKRAKGVLSYGVIHREKDHLHFHLCISANYLESSQKHRISKYQLRDFKREIERYRLEKYPELEIPILYDLELKKELKYYLELHPKDRKLTHFSQEYQPLVKNLQKYHKDLQILIKTKRDRELEQYYQDLEQRLDKPNNPKTQTDSYTTTSNKEFQAKKRMRQPTRKERAKYLIQDSLNKARTIEELRQLLESHQLEIKSEGNTYSVMDLEYRDQGAKKYTFRLNKLEIEQEYKHKEQELLQKQRMKKDFDFEMERRRVREKSRELVNERGLEYGDDE